MERIGYARVSTKDPDQIGALEQQIDRLRAMGCTEILSDVESGKNAKRPQYNRLLNKIPELGRGLTVIVTRLDRLTRSLPELRRFVEVVERHGTTLIALDDQIDLSTSAGRFQLNMLGALAEMESDRMGERIKHGHAYRRKQKKPVPGLAPFGYRKNGDKLELDDTPVICFEGKEWSRAELARLRIDCFFQTGSLQSAAREYNHRIGLQNSGITIPRLVGRLRTTGNSLCSWLCNPILRGKICYGRGSDMGFTYSDPGEVIDGACPAIMTESEIAEIRRIVGSNQRRGKRQGGGFMLFSGLIRCANCGGVYVGRRWWRQGEERIAYGCRRRRNAGDCPSAGVINEQTLIEAVYGAFGEKLDELWRAESQAMDSAQKAKPEAPEITERRQQIAALRQIPPSPPIDQAIAALNRELQVLLQIESNEDLERDHNRREILTVWRDPNFWQWLKNSERPELRRFFLRYVTAITVDGPALVAVTLNL